MAVVVLPTPPFWLATATIFAITYLHCETYGRARLFVAYDQFRLGISLRQDRGRPRSSQPFFRRFRSFNGAL